MSATQQLLWVEAAQADHQLRTLLFGNGDTTPGSVRGEDARLQVADELNKLQEERCRFASLAAQASPEAGASQETRVI